MSKIKDVLKQIETEKGAPTSEMEEVRMIGICPPIEKMDSLNTLKACKKLCLSTNCIDKIGSLAGLPALEILSIGRNQIKRLENLDAVSDTLRELWISYNYIEKLGGIEKLKKLKVLYISNNKIDKWQEFERLKELPELEELVFVGNPLERTAKDRGEIYRQEILKRLPNLKKLDGQLVTDADRVDQTTA